jgi:RNA polymerase-binding transcription factor DksA
MAKSSKKATSKKVKPVRSSSGKTMAKSKNKKLVKVVKKATPVKAKKASAKKPVKAAKPAKKKIAKKAAPKKVVKPVAKSAVKTAKAVTVAKPVAKPVVSNATNPLKAAPSALNIFPNTTPQRPIAHRPATKTVSSNSDNRTRYGEDELKEFEELINEKLDKAKTEYKILKDTLNRNNDEGTDATSGGNTKVLEDGAETAEKENMSQLAARQQKYIMNLENALVRIKNGTYGICSVTGKLISKERLMAVPHTTQSIEAKMLKQD